MTVRRIPRLACATFLLLTVVVPSAYAELEPEVWRQVQEDARRLFVGPGGAYEKGIVLSRLVEDGETRSWKLLVDLLVAESGHWLATRQAVARHRDWIARVKGKPMARRMPEEQSNLGRWQTELVGLEETALAEREVLDAFVQAAAEGPPVLRRRLYARAKGSPKWELRATAARVAGVHVDDDESFGLLGRALATDQNACVRRAGVEGLGRVAASEGTDASAQRDRRLTGLLAGRLADRSWVVQLLAARVLRERKLTQAVPDLVDALADARPRVATEIQAVLRALTGVDEDLDHPAWVTWWGEHRSEFDSDRDLKAAPKPARAPLTLGGRPVHTDRVLFLLCTSASMRQRASSEGPLTAPGNPGSPPPEVVIDGPKIEVAKAALRNALLGLPPTARFGVVAFGTAVVPWRDSMQAAHDRATREARRWTRALRAEGLGNHEAALRMAFWMAGIDAADGPFAEAKIDTIVLISDGVATHGDASGVRLQDPEEILRQVRRWNRLQLVRIHCVGVKPAGGADFLRDLAAESGGIYVDW